MLNVSPIGRNCSREERNEYEVYDLVRTQALHTILFAAIQPNIFFSGE
jgi:hypothetical protein